MATGQTVEGKAVAVFNAHTCLRCGYWGTPGVREVYETRDQMYDRRPTRDLLEVDCCTECGSTRLDSAPACDACHAAPAAPGTDYCAACDLELDLEEALVGHHNAARAA